jgi:hypothetical protein
MELVASKCYHPSGIITITIMFQVSLLAFFPRFKTHSVQKVIYVSVMEGGGENPLLDSRFPDVSAKGRGYQLQSYPEGIEGWPSLRRVTIWQTVAALEVEFRERAAKFAEAKRNAEANQLQINETKLDSGGNVADGSSLTEVEEETMAVGKSFEEDVGSKSEKGSKKADKVESGLSAQGIGGGVNVIAEVAERKEEPTLTKKGSKSSMKSLSNSDLKDLSSLKLSEEPTSSPSRFSVARPHHIPKMESLSKKLDQIRSEMGEEVRGWR